MHTPSATDVERFLALVEIRTPRQCWWWRGAIHGPSGQAWFYLHELDRQVYGARYAWEAVWGREPIKPNEVIVRVEHDWDRVCRPGPTCAHLLCMNPDHMRAVSRSEFIRDIAPQSKRRRE